MCPELEYDEFIGNVLITPKEKQQYYKRMESEKIEQTAINDD